MITALIAGRLGDTKFPGRNTFPLMGRPLMVYPILAAKHARLVDRVYVTTDAPDIARVAKHHGVAVLERSPKLSGPSTTLEELLPDAFLAMARELGHEPEMIVLLLCNAPTVTSGMIEHGIELLRESRDADAVVSVSQHNEFSPWFAQRLAADGSLQPLTQQTELSIGPDAYFMDALLWVVRPRAFLGEATKTVRPNDVVNSATQRVLPLIHEGYGDVDYRWQIPMVEEWLRRRGFSEEATPYDKQLAAPEASPARPQNIGRLRSQRAANRVLVTTVPFSDGNRRPLDLLEENSIDYTINPVGRKLQESELAEMIGDYGLLIAGTERISTAVMDRAPHLRLISRVGIGLDNVDLLAARRRDIVVSYTPDAPSPAVAELTVGVILSLLRFIPHADRGLRSGMWHRFMGRRLEKLTVGVLGVGRVGKRVIRHLTSFGPRLLANDLRPDLDFGVEHNVEWVEKDVIYREADVITLHLPRTHLTHNLITRREIDVMKPATVLINTSRGNMISESDLAEALRSNRISGAAIDVFSQEPYSGELSLLENCLLTSHMGSMSHDCRQRMELEATEEVIRFVRNEPLRQVVPDHEYAIHAEHGQQARSG